ncbi:MAG TPA: hypothetical protein VGI81_19770 [Tepidisphaeraceae bacterium]|jgi:hypothetical protein
MSVTLGVQWADGRYECRSGVGQYTARCWASEAKSIGLKMLSQIDMNGWPQFGPDQLEALIGEFLQLKTHLEAKDLGGYAEGIDRIVSDLSQLRGQYGWEGDFG